MFFKKKAKKNEAKCMHCNSNVDNKKYRFCPYCGESFIDEEQELKEFGMLGQDDMADEEIMQNMFANANMGIADKLLNNMMQQLMKTLNRQFNELENTDITEVRSFPNGIKIKISPARGQQLPQRQTRTEKQELTEKQIKKIANLPRTEAKTTVRRLSDKVVYELVTPGVESTEDVFVSKLETGYEIKAIGKNKVYVNSFPINLPLRRFWLQDKGLVLEFSLQ